MLFNKYPYTDFHELNLDWIIARIKELGIVVDDFVALNTIVYNGNWDITKQYPAWNIVTDNNMGYISIKPVPAGIAINDTDYWVKIFDYSEWFNKFEVYVNKRYIFIGDSYEGTSKWGPKLIADLGLDLTLQTYTSQLRGNADNTAYIAAQGGMGFTNIGGGPDPNVNGFLSLLRNAYPFIEKPETITNIVILAGANDAFWSIMDSYVMHNMNDFADYANEKFPNAELNIGFIARIRGTNPSNITFENLLTSLYNFSNNPRFAYMNGMETSLYLTDAATEPDNLHPNEAGGGVIAKNAAQILRGGNCVNTWNGLQLSGTVTPVDGTSSPAMVLKPVLFDGNMKHFDVAYFGYAPTNRSVSGEFNMKIGTHSLFYANKDFTIPVQAIAITNKFESVNASIRFSGHDIYLQGTFNETDASWTTHTVYGFAIDAFSFDVPALWT